MNTTQTQSLPSISELFKQIFSFYFSNWKIILGISGVPFILGIAQILAEKYAPAIFIGIIFVIIFIVSFISRMALFSAITEDGKPVGGISGSYKKGLKMLIPFVWASSYVALTAVGGFFAFIIPALIVSIFLSFSLYIVFTEERRGISALVASWYYVRGHWWPVFWRILFFGILFTLIFALVGLLIEEILIGPGFFTKLIAGEKMNPNNVPLASEIFDLFFSNLFLTPLVIIYPYLIYRSLKEIKGPAPAEDPKIKKNITIFMTIGIAGLVLSMVIAGLLLIGFLIKTIGV